MPVVEFKEVTISIWCFQMLTQALPGGLPRHIFSSNPEQRGDYKRDRCIDRGAVMSSQLLLATVGLQRYPGGVFILHLQPQRIVRRFISFDVVYYCTLSRSDKITLLHRQFNGRKVGKVGPALKLV